MISSFLWRIYFFICFQRQQAFRMEFGFGWIRVQYDWVIPLFAMRKQSSQVKLNHYHTLKIRKWFDIKTWTLNGSTCQTCTHHNTRYDLVLYLDIQLISQQLSAYWMYLLEMYYAIQRLKTAANQNGKKYRLTTKMSTFPFFHSSHLVGQQIIMVDGHVVFAFVSFFVSFIFMSTLGFYRMWSGGETRKCWFFTF